MSQTKREAMQREEARKAADMLKDPKLLAEEIERLEKEDGPPERVFALKRTLAALERDKQRKEDRIEREAEVARRRKAAAGVATGGPPPPDDAPPRFGPGFAPPSPPASPYDGDEWSESAAASDS